MNISNNDWKSLKFNITALILWFQTSVASEVLPAGASGQVDISDIFGLVKLFTQIWFLSQNVLNSLILYMVK